MFLFEVFDFKIVLDAPKTLLNLNLSLGLILDLLLLSLGVLVWVLHAQLAHEHLDIEFI